MDKLACSVLATHHGLILGVIAVQILRSQGVCACHQGLGKPHAPPCSPVLHVTKPVVEEILCPVQHYALLLLLVHKLRHHRSVALDTQAGKVLSSDPFMVKEFSLPQTVTPLFISWFLQAIPQVKLFLKFPISPPFFVALEVEHCSNFTPSKLFPLVKLNHWNVKLQARKIKELRPRNSHLRSQYNHHCVFIAVPGGPIAWIASDRGDPRVATPASNKN